MRRKLIEHRGYTPARHEAEWYDRSSMGFPAVQHSHCQHARVDHLVAGVFRVRNTRSWLYRASLADSCC